MSIEPVPDAMRAAVVTAPGPPGVLRIMQRPVPQAGSGEILVRVRASALNRADTLQRAGRYPAPPGVPPDIPGLEFAGEVVACGPEARRWAIGSRVMGLVGGGAHAEYLVTHERAVAPVPDTLTDLEAGAAPEACITAHDALVAQANVRPGETVLVHAVGSGVGLAAVQIARALGAQVYGTTRSAEKLEVARSYGMADGIAPGEIGWLKAASKRLTDGRGFDVVLDLLGGDYVRESAAAMALMGRMVLIGTLAGLDASLDLRVMLARRLTVRGTVLRARPLEERIVATQTFAREIVPWLANRSVTTRLDAVYPLERIAEAHAHMEGNSSIGKIVLSFQSENHVEP